MTYEVLDIIIHFQCKLVLTKLHSWLLLFNLDELQRQNYSTPPFLVSWIAQGFHCTESFLTTPITQLYIHWLRTQLWSNCILAYSSPYYPSENSINESCHKSLEHGIKRELERGCVYSFEEILRRATMGYNASYQSVIGDAPLAWVFGKSPLLPGVQGLATVHEEQTRITLLRETEMRRIVQDQLAQIEKPDIKEYDKIAMGDCVIFPRS